jgi:Tfp pilus assembly protein PilO
LDGGGEMTRSAHINDLIHATVVSVFALTIAFEVAAWAQQPATHQVTPEAIQMALVQKVTEAMNTEIQLRAQLIEAQNRIKDLEAQLPKTSEKK